MDVVMLAIMPWIVWIFIVAYMFVETLARSGSSSVAPLDGVSMSALVVLI